jgi:IS5 family transposase
MYTKEPAEHQYSFKHDWFMTPEVDRDHIIIKIADAIDWSALSEKLAKFYCPDNGRPTKPARAKIGLLMLKRLYDHSDETAVDMLKRDIYAQYLCDVSLKEAVNFIDPSTLTYFRKKIGAEGVRLIEDEVLKTLEKNKAVRGRKLIVDTTVMPANIAYPTDIQLLDKVRTKAVKLLDRAKNLGAGVVRTCRRVARRVVIQYQKIRKHTVQERRRVQKKLIQFATRNVRQLTEALTVVNQTAGTGADKIKEQFILEAGRFLKTADTILQQQRKVYRREKVTSRIVSLHRTHLRPMVRGKFPVEVEFGPKLLLNQRGKCLFLEGVNFENVSDSQLLKPSLDGYESRFKSHPTQLAADRGFWSQDNQLLAEQTGISKIAIENKGKSSHLVGKPFRERLRRLRCGIEAKISLAKRRFGLDRCLYSIPGGEEIWARWGLLTMNLKLALSG